MIWIVDTCIILDILENDPEYGLASALLLQSRLAEGLGISPVTQVELAPAFAGDFGEQRRFLSQAGIVDPQDWSIKDTEKAHWAWHTHVATRRAGLIPKRPIADLLIGAFAANRRGLITRNAKDFQKNFPGLQILEP